MHLLEMKERLDTAIQIQPTDIEFRLSRAWISTRLMDVEKFQRQDQESAKAHFDQSLKDWLSVIGDGDTFPNDLWKLENIYNNLKGHINAYENVAEKKYTYARILTAIEQTSDLFGNAPKIAAIAADSALRLGELQQDSEPRDALKNLTKAIDRFQTARILEETSTYSESYTWVCSAYTTRLVVNRSLNNISAALQDLENIKNRCLPVFETYDFDFYLHDQILRAHLQVGEMLFDERRFLEAQPSLEYASYWGRRDATKLLAQMYREGLGVTSDRSRASELAILAEKQSMKRFTIQADFKASGKHSFHVYVYQKPADYPYKGIDAQAEWLKQARGGTIPENIMESFREIQGIAAENDVSFPELAVEAVTGAE